MSLFQIIVLAIVQGLTEFLPISSSAHLILVPVISDWPDQGLAFDVAVHVGTLIAVVWYFRHEVVTLTMDWGKSLLIRKKTGESDLAWAVIWATVPVVIAGLLFHDLIDTVLRSPIIIAWATIIFGLLLWVADSKGAQLRSEHQIGIKGIMIIGLSQALALIPGTSRSGITMTAGLFLGLTRTAAARFSFLLSIPTILMAGSYKTYYLIKSDITVDWTALGLGILLSAVTAYLCIHVFLKLLERMGMKPFVFYRLLLGVVLLYLFS